MGDEGRKSLVIWSYGIGEEGIRSFSNSQETGVIIDDKFPWWCNAVRAMGINILSIWLRSDDTFPLSYVKPIVGHTPIQCGPHPSETTLSQLVNCDWVLIGLKHKTPTGWHLSYHTFKHADVGGVTDGVHGVYILSRGVIDRLVTDETPGQDLRSVLESGEDGTLDSNVIKPMGVQAATSVRYCGPCIVEESSLYPTRHKSVMIRTQWRGYRWVRRKLSLFEQLLSMDVPEKLIRMIPEGTERVHLLILIRIPVNPRLNKRDRWNAILPSIPEVVGHESEDEGWLEQDHLLAIGKHNDKATKKDDADVRISLWDQYLLNGLEEKIDSQLMLKYVRWFGTRMLMKWKRRLTKSFFTWARANHIDHCERRLEIYNNAKDCIARAADSTCWSWDRGSRPFFWRWPTDYIDTVRNGSCVWFDGQVEPWTKRQRGVTDPVRQTLIEAKLDTIRSKGYVETGSIISLMSFFDVPKGTDDIRMVYDGLASGLNGYLWAPWFSLPTYSCLLRALEPGYSMADNDVGEMFHNFMLHPSLRKYCGLDMSLYSPSEHKMKQKKQLWMRWNRLAMGLRPSPYCAVQGMMIAREAILGDRFNEGNVFRWNNARLNLPGSDEYNPSKAWYTKVRLDGTVAADVFIYVDDIRCSAPSQIEAWQASQRTSSVLGFLKLQDAARKRRDPGQETGAWTGSVVWTSEGQISIMTTQEKWEKVKCHLNWIQSNIENEEGLDNKRLQSIRGFLVYVSRTYGSLVPYLKGLHSTIDSWRFGRTATGWKIGSKKLKLESDQRRENQSDWDERFGLTPLSESEPTHVMPVPRFRHDLKCLIELTSSESPPRQMGRMKTQAKVMYGFGDASKHGFGASIELPDKSLYWCFGQWRLESEDVQHHLGPSTVQTNENYEIWLRHLNRRSPKGC